MCATRTIRTPEDVTNLVTFLGDMEMPYRVATAKGAKRSLSQNNVVHKWFSEIARQSDDRDLMDVKADCNMAYGVPILRRDDEIYSRFLDKLNLTHEQMIFAFRKGYIQCTSLMTTRQLKEYMDGMGRDYRQQGYTLTDPELLKAQEDVT